MPHPVSLTPEAAPPNVPPHRKLLGETLVEQGLVGAETLVEALTQQGGQEAPLGRILINAEAITPDDLLHALGHQTGLPLVDLRRCPPAPKLLDGLDPEVLLSTEALPWRAYGPRLVVAVSSPTAKAAAAEMLGRDETHLEFVLARADELRRAVVMHFGPIMRDGAAHRCPPAYSCRRVGSRRFRWRAAGVIGAGVAALAAAPVLVLQAVMVWTVAMNGMTTGLRLVALLARFRAGQARVDGSLPRLNPNQKLPTVSLLVPLKGEARVVGDLVRALDALDYPRALLDVKLVLEESDVSTRAAIDPGSLPRNFEMVTVPRDQALETKPRALNYALPFCRGSIVGVYDAEDRPDPEQIRAVVVALQEAPQEVACVQGYLDFYNPTDNWLARCFTIEYAAWFRVLLHGVQRLGIPIPLGGTTVFFRRRVLEEIGAWDAHNVTEDADLGMRLARFGYRCAMIQSTTFEEANCRPMRWIRQRSRWLKGYAITWATHMREPRSLLRDLGWTGFVGFQVLFLGAITSYLAIPLLWAGLVAGHGFGLNIWGTLPAPLAWSFILSLLLGQALMMSIACLALKDAGRGALAPWILVLPVYWPLGAVAAYRAVVEVFTSPFHWHKTEHGLAHRRTG